MTGVPAMGPVLHDEFTAVQEAELRAFQDMAPETAAAGHGWRYQTRPVPAARDTAAPGRHRQPASPGSVYTMSEWSLKFTWTGLPSGSGQTNVAHARSGPAVLRAIRCTA